MRLPGKVALVTGGGRGIGRSVALRLAEEGADVAVADVDGRGSAETAQQVRARGRQALSITADVSDVDQIEAMISSVWTAFHHIDTLVNNAGVASARPLLDLPPEEWDRILAVNTRGLFFCLQRAARRMVAQRSGTIINIASVGAMRPRPLAVHYAASKAAVISITRSAAAALAPYGVTVNVVCPALVETPMQTDLQDESAKITGIDPAQECARRLSEIPLGRFGEPEDIAGVVAFLASPDAAFMTGQTVTVSGGLLMV